MEVVMGSFENAENNGQNVEDDTIKLLRECNAGVKMGILSLDDVMDHVKDRELRDFLMESKSTHEELGNRTRDYLNECHDKGKEPTTMARVMSWMKTNVKLSDDESDKVVAELITDGCNMGVKSLYQYLNQYKAADNQAKDLTKRIISAEENLIKKLQAYL